MNPSPLSRWSKLRAPLAVLAVTVFLGTAVVAPFAMPTAQADFDEAAFQLRIHQEFTPNENPTDDLVYAEVPIIELPDPEEERLRLEAEAEAKRAEEAAKQAASAPAAPSTPAPLRYTGGGSPAEWMAAAGIAESEWGYVDFIVSKESGWNPNAVNPSSGASGLVQALPCGKVPGSCFDPVDNLRWADGYAKGRYGSWAAAYAFWTANHWW